MHSYLHFLQALPETAEDYKQWWLNDLGPRIAESGDCIGLCVNLVVSPPGTEELYRSEARIGEGYDVTVDLICPDEGTYRRIMERYGPDLLARTKADHGYRVELSVEKDDAEKLRGHPSPGYKIMRGFFSFDDLPDSAFRRSWDVHVELAKKVHGFARYVRYFVVEPVTEGAPAIRAATSLHFATARDAVERYFRIPGGREMIAHDTRHFIDCGLARVFTREYRLK